MLISRNKSSWRVLWYLNVSCVGHFKLVSISCNRRPDEEEYYESMSFLHSCLLNVGWFLVFYSCWPEVKLMIFFTCNSWASGSLCTEIHRKTGIWRKSNCLCSEAMMLTLTFPLLGVTWWYFLPTLLLVWIFLEAVWSPMSLPLMKENISLH